MPAEEMPSFASEETHTATINGRAYTFYAVSSLTFLRLQERLGPAFAKVLDVMVTGQDLEVRQRAIAELLAAAGKSGALAGELVLDALHDEKWIERPASPVAVDKFLQRCSGPILVAMLAAVAAANGAAFRPLVDGLLVSGRTLASSLPSREEAGESS